MRRIPHILYRAVTNNSPLIWADQSVGYRSALPGASGYGFDSYGGFGQHPTNPVPNTTNLIFVDDTGSGTSTSAHPTEPRTWFGTLRGAQSLAQSLHASDPATPIVVLLTRSGAIDVKSDLRFGSYVTLAGHFSPTTTILRHAQLSTAIAFGTSTAIQNQWLHLDNRMDDDSAGIPPTDRDAAYMGSVTTGGEVAQNIAINCGFLHSSDEIVDAYTGVDLLAFHGCVFGEPLHYGIRNDGTLPHGFGPIIGQQYRAGRVSFARNLFAHIAARHPLIAALRFAFANNLIYNPGDPDGNIANLIELVNDYDAPSLNTAPMYTNVEQNLVVRGVNGYSGGTRFVYMDPASQHPAGSQGYLAGNQVDGWTYASQSALTSGTFPSGWLQASRIAAAWPAGWENITTISASANPNGASAAEKLAFAQRIYQTVGPKPGYTDTTYNRCRAIAAHVIARLSGSGDQGRCINSISGSYTGAFPNISERFAPSAYPAVGNGIPATFPTPASVAMNPYSPGPYAATPCPLVADGRDTPYTSGVFSNGKSRAGYTPLQEWVIEQHWDVTPT